MLKRNKSLKRTPLKRVSEKRKRKAELEKQERDTDMEFYLSIWNSREHICEYCGAKLGKEPLTVYFDHILEKSKYPELRYNEKNIWLLCMTCHDNKSRGNLSDSMKQKIQQIAGLLKV